MKQYTWPLAVSPFTLLDKTKIAWNIISKDRYTMGERVVELERDFSQLSGRKALMVANGSVANQLVFELWKIKNPSIKPVVIVPAVTWISSITPAMMAGMDIVFCDVNLNDFSFDLESLKRIAKEQYDMGRRIIIWPTALIGWSPKMGKIASIAKEFKADLYLDACENTLADADVSNGLYNEEPKFSQILASADITTTSCYLSHYICSVEGGFVFFKNQDDYDLAKMFRNHGMVRSLPQNHPMRVRIEAEASDVDPLFLFALPGTNIRPSDVHAMFGVADFKRLEKNRSHRIDIYNYYYNNLDKNKYYLPKPTNTHIAFCLPVFRMDSELKRVKNSLGDAGIETRPIIGSNLLRQIPFKSFGKPEDFKNADWIHRHGTYVGLHHKVDFKMIDRLINILNSL